MSHLGCDTGKLPLRNVCLNKYNINNIADVA